MLQTYFPPFLNLFEPIHTFKEKPVAGPAYHTQKNKRHKFIFQHLKILLVLILFIVSPFYIPTVCQTDKKLREEKNISKLRFQLKSRSRWPPFHFEKVTFPEWKSSLFHASIWSKCFINENRFKFADENDNWYKWTVFLRDNNTGKTNLLKAIAVWNLIMIPPLLRRQVVSIRFCGQKQQYSKSFSFRKTRVPYPMSILGHYNPYSSIFR